MKKIWNQIKTITWIKPFSLVKKSLSVIVGLSLSVITYGMLNVGFTNLYQIVAQYIKNNF